MGSSLSCIQVEFTSTETAFVFTGSTESQERMAVDVAAEDVDEFLAYAREENLEATVWRVPRGRWRRPRAAGRGAPW